MNFLSRMERKFGRYAINGLMKYIIVFYIIGYIIEFMAPSFQAMITLEPYMIFHYGQVWRLISWLLIPPSSSNIFFMIIMMVLYYQLGTALEQTWGAFRFNVFIFGGIIFTIIGALVLFFIYGFNTPVSIGYSFSTYYINLSIFLAFALCYPDMRVMLYFIIPVKMKWMALVYAALLVYELIYTSWAGKAAIIASILNLLVFFMLTKNMGPASYKQAKRRRDFRRQQQEAAPKGVSKHKCAICGRTELDDPDLEFRFCSKCNGNYEYCSEHLYTHRHII